MNVKYLIKHDSDHKTQLLMVSSDHYLQSSFTLVQMINMRTLGAEYQRHGSADFWGFTPTISPIASSIFLMESLCPIIHVATIN